MEARSTTASVWSPTATSSSVVAGQRTSITSRPASLARRHPTTCSHRTGPTSTRSSARFVWACSTARPPATSWWSMTFRPTPRTPRTSSRSGSPSAPRRRSTSSTATSVAVTRRPPWPPVPKTAAVPPPSCSKNAPTSGQAYQVVTAPPTAGGTVEFDYRLRGLFPGAWPTVATLRSPQLRAIPAEQTVISVG